MRKFPKTFSDILTIKHSWPKKGDRLLRTSNDWEAAASFAPHPISRNAFIWDGYMIAGAALIDEAQCRSHERNLLLYRKLNDDQKRVIIERLHESVWSFNEWRKIGKKAFGAEFVQPPPVEGESDGKSRRLGRGGSPESKEHRRLKEYVAKHPNEFGAPKECKEGMVEWRLLSTDEIDVWFMSVGEQLAVEVKSRRSTMADIERGIFQCVKYGALLEAQSQVARFTTKQNIRALLVSEQPLSPKLARWANKLDVEVRVIRPLR